jgi:hypothetical protein
VIEWAWVTIPSGFTKDTWVTSVQIKPGHPAVAHHMCLAFKPHTPAVRYFVPLWIDQERDTEGAALPEQTRGTFGGRAEFFAGTNGLEDCYLPGMNAADYRIHNAAKLIPAGSDIMINLHYTPNGTTITDHVQIGFTVAQTPSKRRYISLSTSSPIDSKRFAIPPRDPNWSSPPWT